MQVGSLSFHGDSKEDVWEQTDSSLLDAYSLDEGDLPHAMFEHLRPKRYGFYNVRGVMENPDRLQRCAEKDGRNRH